MQSAPCVVRTKDGTGQFSGATHVVPSSTVPCGQKQPGNKWRILSPYKYEKLILYILLCYIH